jgi:cytochrome c oxidase cbb3-type subunit 3
MRVGHGLNTAAASAFVMLTAIGVHLGAQGQKPAYPQFQRPPADPAVVERGKAIYGIRCGACHGADLRGGDQGGPNLLRSEIVLMDQKGEGIIPIIQNGRQSPGMPGMAPVPLPPDDMLAVAEYLHSVLANAGRQGRPPLSATPPVLNVLVGDIEAGRAYFAAKCSSCHSVTADLKGIASRVTDPKQLQNFWVSGGGPRGGGPAGDSRSVRVTVTPAAGAPVEGRLVRIDDFVVTLVQDDGTRRSFRRNGEEPRVDVRDPLAAHRALVPGYTDKDMHDVTAFLAVIK